MKIPFNLNILRLTQDPLQSFSTFQIVVKKLEHFQNQHFLTDFDMQIGTAGPFFGQKSPKLFVEAFIRKFLLI